MIKQIYLIVLVVVLSSCTLLKQRSEAESSNLHRVSEVFATQEKDSNSQSHLLMIRDSMQEDYHVEIIPTGVFSYSINDGFKGMAASVKVKGSKSNNFQVNESKEASALHERSEMEMRDKMDQQTSKERKSFRFSVNFYIYIVVGVIIAWLWYRVRLRS